MRRSRGVNRRYLSKEMSYKENDLVEIYNPTNKEYQAHLKGKVLRVVSTYRESSFDGTLYKCEDDFKRVGCFNWFELASSVRR